MKGIKRNFICKYQNHAFKCQANIPVSVYQEKEMKSQ